jgi:hypothetical protein
MNLRLSSCVLSPNGLIMALLLPDHGKPCVCALRSLRASPCVFEPFCPSGFNTAVKSQIVVIMPSRHIPDIDMSSVLCEEDIRPGVGHKGFYNFDLMKRNEVLYRGAFPHSCCIYPAYRSKDCCYLIPSCVVSAAPLLRCSLL